MIFRSRFLIKKAAGFDYFPSYRYAELVTGEVGILMGIKKSPLEVPQEDQSESKEYNITTLLRTYMKTM